MLLFTHKRCPLGEADKVLIKEYYHTHMEQTVKTIKDLKVEEECGNESSLGFTIHVGHCEVKGKF